MCDILINDLKVDVNQSVVGYSLLYRAAYDGLLDICSLMLEVPGIDINFTNSVGTSVLGAAA